MMMMMLNMTQDSSLQTKRLILFPCNVHVHAVNFDFQVDFDEIKTPIAKLCLNYTHWRQNANFNCFICAQQILPFLKLKNELKQKIK